MLAKKKTDREHGRHHKPFLTKKADATLRRQPRGALAIKEVPYIADKKP
jgi:hypothetical protein